MTKFLHQVNNLDRRHKWIIMILMDAVMMLITLYMAYALRYGEIFPPSSVIPSWPYFLLVIIAGIFYAWMLKIPKIKLQSFDLQAIQRMALSSLLLVLTAMSVSFLFKFTAPRSVPMIFGVLFFTGSLFSRMNALMLLKQLHQIGNDRKSVVIYGAGEAGIQLVSSLSQSKEVKTVAFIDDNKLQQNMVIFGLSVYGPDKLEALIKQKNVESVLIAIPSLAPSERRAMARKLAHLPCDIRIMPSHVEIIHGEDMLNSFVSLKAEDLLERDKFDVVIPNINTPYKSKSILISGAGGSIGSELCRQILQQEPSKLVIFEHSEYALYSIERELKPLANKFGIKLVSILGNVCDAKTVKHVFEKENINVVFHAAAYKHVPLVESNLLAGIHNNVIGTYTIALQALKSEAETFVLISTDKAVRPTNIMGATKRLAELVIQDLDKKSKITKFSMVRFGNVLGSSGSVIPLFRDQIAKGGPVTLTHEDVTRYFMAISEAAYLVIVAGNFAQGGDVFVLDMGKPVKIKELARNMIEKSGFSVRDENNPNGDIEVLITGLRPGEKLYEELLIDAETLPTPHPKVMRAKENSLPPKALEKVLKEIQISVSKNDEVQMRHIISNSVEGYQPPD